ncbi:Flp pilus assembly complex ATPase component TadA [Jeotgalicoccus huakuii]|nr:Flp pilus assembly complex ATPase component TadA [Jeotgalicoccus huakuii]
MKSLVESILTEAHNQSASDIHITLDESGGTVKLRIKGQMVQLQLLDGDTFKRLINYLKFITELDINEHKVPQSGRTTIQLEHGEISVRISTLPMTILRESVVIRILNNNDRQTSRELFYDKKDYIFLSEYMKKAQGLILFTGPTGSGKSTVMYRLIKEIADEGLKAVISIEDPVEYEVPGLVQVEINEKGKLEYAPLIRGVLRCDPDIIMFGEIRDKTIAEELIKTSLSGHLVLSTFHSKSALSTLVRLQDYGLFKEEMAESISLIVNQRLIHTAKRSFIICEYIESKDVEKFLKGETVTYNTLIDKLALIHQESGMNDEEYQHYQRILQ